MATTVFEIPLQPSKNQSFTIDLGGATYGLAVQWREKLAHCWIMKISDVNGNVMVDGIPLLIGANIIGQFTEVAIPGEIWVVNDTQLKVEPTFANLGVESRLYYVVRT